MANYPPTAEILISTWDRADDDARVDFWRTLIHDRDTDLVRIDRMMRRRSAPGACALLKHTAIQFDLFDGGQK